MKETERFPTGSSCSHALACGGSVYEATASYQHKRPFDALEEGPKGRSVLHGRTWWTRL